jgi:hypothetical protein
MNTRPFGMSLVLGTLIAAAVAAGCGPGNGSDDAPPSCLQVQPCGGDVVGTWRFLGACTSPTFLESAKDNLQAVCPGASINTVDVDLGGTITFNADSTYTANADETIAVTETFPLSCLGAASCAEVVSTSADTTLSCTGTATCTCHATGSPPKNDAGTYSISGFDLIMGDATSDSGDKYCVENNRLHIIGVDATTGALLGDFVAQKQ